MSEHAIIAVVLTVVGVLASIIGALLLIGITKTLSEMKAIWEEIGTLKTNQQTLRSEIPRDYIRVKGPAWELLMAAVNRIETHVEELMKGK